MPRDWLFPIRPWNRNVDGRHMTPELLHSLRCPETHQTLVISEPGIIGQLNARVAAGQLRNVANRAVTMKLESGLTRADGKVLYPVRQNVPVLLVDEAIRLL